MSPSPVDIAVVVLNLTAALGIGLHLQRRTRTGKDSFMAGREVTAWVARLSFVAATWARSS